MKAITFYTKSDCPLCDKALAVVESIKSIMPFELQILDITEDRSLFDRFCFDIPVVEIDGEIAFKGHVPTDQFMSAIKS